MKWLLSQCVRATQNEIADSLDSLVSLALYNGQFAAQLKHSLQSQSTVGNIQFRHKVIIDEMKKRCAEKVKTNCSTAGMVVAASILVNILPRVQIVARFSAHANQTDRIVTVINHPEISFDLSLTQTRTRSLSLWPTSRELIFSEILLYLSCFFFNFYYIFVVFLICAILDSHPATQKCRRVFVCARASCC